MAMTRNYTDPDLSQLEREFELEMEEEPGEFEFEEGDEGEFEEGADQEFEEEPYGEFEGVEQEPTRDYARRFYELGQREFESDHELDAAIDGPLNAMQQEFFLGGLRKRWRQLKKRGLGRMLQKGLSFAAGKIPALKAVQNISSAAQAALKGDMKGLIKSGLGAALRAYPGTAALSPALSALGFEAGGDNRQAWENVVTVAREANDYLVANLHEGIDDPPEASRVANEAFQAGLRSAQSAPFATGNRKRGVRVIRVARGQRIKIIIEGV
jgi:hypothetical protein